MLNELSPLQKAPSVGSAERLRKHIQEEADTINEILLPVLRKRIDLLGETEAGAYKFYVVRVQRNNLFSSYELKLAEILCKKALNVSHIQEIGPGYGQLSFLLARLGLKTVAMECDIRRYKTGKILLDELIHSYPLLENQCTLLYEMFPTTPFLPNTSNALALMTNIVATLAIEKQKAFVRALHAYPYIILDVDRLLSQRFTEEERQLTFQLFKEAGHDPPELLLDLGKEGQYYMYHGKGEKEAYRSAL